jgi:antitoxin VapB
MALSIKSDRADSLARELAALTGESITDAVVASLEVRLELERRRRRSVGVDDIVERFARLPVLDTRTPDEILCYGADGIPT